MKRIITASIILTFIISLSFSTNYLIKTYVNQTIFYLNMALESVNSDNEKCIEYIETAYGYWSKKCSIMALFTSHTDIYNINSSIIKTYSYLSSGDENEFMAEINSTIYALSCFLDTQKLSLQNLL